MAELGRRTGNSRLRILRLETGKTTVTADDLVAIAAALGTNATRLGGGR